MTARQLVAALLAKGQLLSTAESCTGGMVAAAITDIMGSSGVFDRGFVTYSNAAKIQMLGVPPSLLETHGAVSEAVATAMAQGALMHSAATLAVSTTGIAGPGGGTETKPVGLVHFACTNKSGRLWNDRMIFPGDRATVRRLACDHALQMLGNALAG